MFLKRANCFLLSCVVVVVYRMRVNPENGLLYLQLIKSTHLVKAYKKTQEIVVSEYIIKAFPGCNFIVEMVVFLRRYWHKKELTSEHLLFVASATSVPDPRDNSGCLPGEGMRLLGSEQARFEPDDDDLSLIHI